MKKVSIVGLGYTGLPTLIAVSKTNLYTVTGYDIDENKISSIEKHISPIEDPDVSSYIKNHSFSVSSDPSILKNSDIFIICVPTPVHNDYTPDYSFIESATETVAKFLKKGSHVVLESTVNPGTCKEVLLPLLTKHSKLKAGKDYNIAHCPERINPGDNIWNIYNIPRNVGSINKKFNKEIARFYRTFIHSAKINEVSSLEVAEASKIVENAFRDINIAYVNELAKSFDAMGIDLYETLQASSTKPFGFLPHWPGCGVGGHCIGVDPYYLIKKAENNGFNHLFLKLAREINNSMPTYTVQKLILGLNELGLPIKNTKIALLGLSYKPNVGDMRESPSMQMKHKLLELGAHLTLYDPFIKTECSSLEEAVSDAIGVLIATSHAQFVEQLPLLLPKSKVKIVMDGRNCLDKKFFKKHTILYKGIGR